MNNVITEEGRRAEPYISCQLGLNLVFSLYFKASRWGNHYIHSLPLYKHTSQQLLPMRVQ